MSSKKRNRKVFQTGEEKVMREGREVSVEIERIVHTVDPNFWVPAVGNG